MDTTEKDIKRQAANFLYTFLEDSEITSALAGKYRNIVLLKKYAQLRYLKGTAVASNHEMDEIVGWVKEAISDTYAEQVNPNTGKYASATPRLILYHLAEGRPAGGKDWNASKAAGVGEVTDWSSKLSEYKISFNKNTGTLTSDSTGAAIVADNNYYNGTLFAKNYDLTTSYGAALTASYNKSTGLYDLSAVADKTGSIKDSGGTEKSQTALNVLQVTAMMMPQIMNIVSSIRQWLTGDNISTSSEIALNQVNDGWSSGTQNAGVSPWLFAGLLLGGVALTSKDMNPFRKSKKR